ncbi:MAG: hypothetical protein QM811_02555 [Pirellulales bacterium]
MSRILCRALLCLSCVVAIGCDRREPEPTVCIEPAFPTETGVLDFTFGPIHEQFSPQNTANPGSRWLGTKVLCRNVSNASIWIHGHGPDSPFYGLQTRATKQDMWIRYDIGFCGTGAVDHEIPAGATFTFDVAVPEMFDGHELRVVLDFRKQPRANERFETTSQEIALTAKTPAPPQPE